MGRSTGSTAWRHRAAAALLAWGLGSGPGAAATAEAPVPMADSGLDAAEVFERASPSIWMVLTGDEAGRPVASGSAVVIARNTLITNCHVLAKAARVAIRRDNVVWTVQKAEADAARDLCLLRADRLDAPAVVLAHEASLRPGMRVYAVGAPRRLEQTISDGLLSGLRRDDKGELVMVQTSAPISPGSSGGGLFDTQGRLIGVTTSGFKDGGNLNFAVPARLVEALSRRAGRPEWQARTAPAEVPLHPPVAAAPLPPAAPVAAVPAMPASPAAPAAPPAASPAASPPVALAPAAPPAVPAMAPGAATTGRWTQIEYQLRDRLTGNVRNVVYRADAVTDGTQSFNNGGWVERADGQVLRIGAAIAGEFDGVMPPQGWVRPRQLSAGDEWSTRYSLPAGGGGRIDMDLKAQVEGPETLSVAGRALSTVRIDYRGYTTRIGNSVASSQNQTARYRASAWWSPELGRVVRFTAQTRGGLGGGLFVVDEALELAAIR